MGRMTERPSAILGIVSIIVGFVFLIVFVAKVLPAFMYAGVPDKTEVNLEEDSGIEGRDGNDDDPSPKTRSPMKACAKKPKNGQSQGHQFGIPPLNEDIVWGTVALLGGLIGIFLGRSMYRKQNSRSFLPSQRHRLSDSSPK